jgi:hypothetical protein
MGDARAIKEVSVMLTSGQIWRSTVSLDGVVSDQLLVFFLSFLSSELKYTIVFFVCCLSSHTWFPDPSA